MREKHVCSFDPCVQIHACTCTIIELVSCRVGKEDPPPPPKKVWISLVSSPPCVDGRC